MRPPLMAGAVRSVSHREQRRHEAEHPGEDAQDADDLIARDGRGGRAAHVASVPDATRSLAIAVLRAWSSSEGCKRTWEAKSRPPPP